MSRLMHVTTGPYAPPVARRELTAVSADGARLHVEEHGPEGAPAVVLAHGWTCSIAFWAAVVRQLAPDHRVIVYDQRGHGRTPATRRGSCSTTTLADDLQAALEAALAPGEKAVVGGHSMGGMTLMAAADRPYLRERAAALLLCSTGSSGLPQESRVIPVRTQKMRLRAHRGMLITRLPMGPVTPLAKSLLKYATMGKDATPAQVEACARIVHACPRAARGDWGRVLDTLDLDAEVARLPLPTAVVHGTADRLTPLVHARRLAAALPECAGLTELDGVGHMTPVEAPHEVAGLLRGLVRDHLRASVASTPAPTAVADEAEKEGQQP